MLQDVAADLPTATFHTGEGHFYPSPHLSDAVPPSVQHVAQEC